MKKTNIRFRYFFSFILNIFNNFIIYFKKIYFRPTCTIERYDNALIIIGQYYNNILLIKYDN